jgi:hypothetical protein
MGFWIIIRNTLVSIFEDRLSDYIWFRYFNMGIYINKIGFICFPPSPC